ncbi:phytoene desaturase family protein [Desulfobacterium sp. N47]|uniref:phytoene desaturase family protein n=1 Tax=Desulfobacterium sp. N47 TaxID=3115210 RepID=UPI003CB6ACCF
MANIDPRLVFPDMVSETDKGFASRVAGIQDPGFSGIMQHMALNEAPKWKAGDHVGKSISIEPLCWLDNFRHLYDELRYGLIPSPENLAPFVSCSTVLDPTRAPAGKHTLYLWHYVPYYLKDGGPAKWDEIKTEVADMILEKLRTHTSNMGPENIIARTIYSPIDYERMNPSLVNGSILGPGSYLHQFFSHRPIPELGQYRTPIDGLYMSGQSFHPGGSITGGGRATVQVVMADLGMDFSSVAKQ